MTKNAKFSDFERFYTIIVKFSIHFVAQNVENILKRKRLQYKRLVREGNPTFPL